MNIITGFYEIPKGKLYINKEDINNYNRNSIFSKYNYAVQANIILDDTIKLNIDIEKNLKEEQIQKAIEKAALKQDIKNLKDKENTWVRRKRN